LRARRALGGGFARAIFAVSDYIDCRNVNDEMEWSVAKDQGCKG